MGVDSINVYKDNSATGESVTLTSGFSGRTVYLDADTGVSYSTSSSKFYAASTFDYDDLDQTSLTVLATTSSFTLDFVCVSQSEISVDTGSSTLTLTSKIYTSVNGGSSYSSSYVGGSITATNTTSSYTVLSQTSTASTSITAYRKNSYKYSTSANTGYHLAKINYGGTTSTSETYYTFSSITSSTYFYAYYDANSYTIAYNSNGGSGSMSSTSTYYSVSTTLRTNTFTRTGYTFAGWSTSSSATSATYSDGATVKNLTSTNGGTVTLYAVWTANSYTIVFDGNGADSGDMESIDATYDEEYTLTANTFTRDGYTFAGWNIEADGSGTSYEDEATVSNLTTEDGATVTLYAQWEQNTVDVTITKVSSNGETTLEGVEFSLYELICEDSSHEHDTDDDLIDTEDYDENCWELVGTYTTGSDGTFTLNNMLQTSTYRLVETKTVDDYLLPSGQWSIKFDDLDEDEVITVDDVSLQITGISNPPAMTAGDETIYIYNYTSYDIPTTGAVGITQILVTGAIIILIGLIDIMHKKKV